MVCGVMLSFFTLHSNGVRSYLPTRFIPDFKFDGSCSGRSFFSAMSAIVRAGPSGKTFFAENLYEQADKSAVSRRTV
jgi:hypothetical protein